MKKEKWNHKRKAYLCKCGKVFLNGEHFNEHLKDTKRWRKYHYAPDIKEIGFIVWIIDKRVEK